MPAPKLSESAGAPAARAVSAGLRALRAALARVDDVLMPQTCAVCGAWIDSRREFACEPCETALRAAAQVPYCGRCGRSAHPFAQAEDGCGECRGERHWNIAGMARIGPYVPELRQLVLGLKYGGRERCAAALGGMLAERLRLAPWLGDVDLLVPVPMHWRRRWFGRSPHAALLAAAVGRRLRLRVAAVVRRVRHTPSQLTLASATARFANIRGCFDVPRPRAVAGRCVCIIDNLAATGATVAEVSKALRRAGARRIYAAVAARSVLWSDFQASAAALTARRGDSPSG